MTDISPWTKELPTRPGDYWFADAMGMACTPRVKKVFEIYGSGLFITSGNTAYSIDDLSGSFWIEIKTPEMPWKIAESAQ